jgi:CRISPR-associated protein Cmr2
VPNRFKAEVQGAFKPDIVIESVRTAWWALAETVYENDLSKLVAWNPHGNTQATWERQIEKFWEITWALTDNEADNSLLDRRKNWRSHLAPDEPGVKCMMMDGWQELSGIATPHGEGLKQFWKQVRDTGKSGISSDLREDGHLCAIALVKRRFVRYFESLLIGIPEMLGGWTLQGWKLPSSVPSVSYMAAVHWLAKALSQGMKKNSGAFTTRPTKLPRIMANGAVTSSVSRKPMAIRNGRPSTAMCSSDMCWTTRNFFSGGSSRLKKSNKR